MKALVAWWALRLLLGGYPEVEYPGVPKVMLASSWGYFTTRDPPEQVAAYFLTRWRTLGVPVTTEGPSDGTSVVSAFFTRERRQELMVAMRGPEGTLAFRLGRGFTLPNAPAKEGVPGGLSESGDAKGLSGGSMRSGVWPISLGRARERWSRALQAMGYQALGSGLDQQAGQTKERMLLRFRLPHRKGDSGETQVYLAEVRVGLTAWTLLTEGVR